MDLPNLTSSHIVPVRDIFTLQNSYFKLGPTKDTNFRIENLKKLKLLLTKHETEIFKALQLDLKKCAFEAHATEYSSTLQEIDLFIKKIPKWSKRQSECNNLLTFPARAYLYPEPYGSVLNIAPWNYPFLLALMPTIGALAAGNTCVIKPSEISENTSSILSKIINENFDPKYLYVVEGDAKVTTELLELPWNYIFFTGSPLVGKIIYQAAAKNLVPVTLELGGKSPCIIHEDAHLENAAKRIIWGKFTNAGQTCVAPDYLLIHEKLKPLFVEKLRKKITEFYGSNPKESPDFGRIISKKHWQRLHSIAIESDSKLSESNFDMNEKYIAPLIFDNVSEASPLMKEEIFGPLLPCLYYKNSNELEEILNRHKTPLACYIFSESADFCDSVINQFSFGGGCVNDVLMHLANHHLPFGGVGSSGIGHYHGKRSFDTFTHYKSVLKQVGFLDFTFFKYPPFNLKKLSILRFITKYFA